MTGGLDESCSVTETYPRWRRPVEDGTAGRSAAAGGVPVRARLRPGCESVLPVAGAVGATDPSPPASAVRDTVGLGFAER